MDEDSKEYDELVKLYVKIWGDRGKLILEKKIDEAMKQGLSRREVIDKLFKREVREETATTIEEVEGIKIEIKYNGRKWGIAYLGIDNFEKELQKLGKVLDYIEEKYGDPVSIVPNIGLTPTSIVLGTSFQGVKGFSLIFKKKT
ncbi:MAG: hypothetical protein ACPLW8_06110 [Candidatus Bathyarchaeales archaeon]|jgi:hypothetical protein